MLASVPRAGSTYLAGLMWSTQCLGAPLEYLNVTAQGVGAFSSSGDTLEDYWYDLQKRRTSENGIFSWKMFVRMYSDVLAIDSRFLNNLAPDFTIYLTREDVQAQAVSYWEAIEQGHWYASSSQRSNVEYDYEAIYDAEIALGNQMRAWERLFDISGIQPLRLSYEVITSEPELSLRKISEFCDTPLTFGACDRSREPLSQSLQPKAQMTDRYKLDRIFLP